MKNKKGFTLVELLAAITILAIIVVISLPKIMSTIGDNKNSIFTESAKNILRQVEYNDIDTSLTSRIALSTLDLNISIADYNLANSYVYKENDVIYLDLVGKGKFSGYTCSGNKISIECGDSTLALNVLKNSGNMYQDDTVDHNYRYKGANPNNYVKFNGEEWRIIGIFKVSDGSITKQRIKIIGPSIGSYSWDTSPSTANDGRGYNIWETKTNTTYKDSINDRTTKADVNRLLNELYLGEENQENPVICYNGRNGNATTNPQVNVKDCPTARLNSNAKGMLENAVWNLGGWTTTAISPLVVYAEERGSIIALSNIAKTEWIGRVGLIYPSDYGYANDNIEINCSTLDKTTCKTNNWLYTGLNFWSLSSYSNNTNIGFGLTSLGYVGGYYRHGSLDIRPVVYLKSNIKIISGNGTSGANAYELSI